MQRPRACTLKVFCYIKCYKKLKHYKIKDGVIVIHYTVALNSLIASLDIFIFEYWRGICASALFRPSDMQLQKNKLVHLYCVDMFLELKEAFL